MNKKLNGILKASEPFTLALANGASFNQPGQVRRNSNLLRPLPVLPTGKTSRYIERAKARAILKKLDIIDLNKSPSSVISHNLLTRNTYSVDLIGKSPANSEIKLEPLAQQHGSYTRREISQKIDLDLTLLQVLEGQRGRGSQVRSKETSN